MSFWYRDTKSPRSSKYEQNALLKDLNTAVKGVVIAAFKINQDKPQIEQCSLVSQLCELLYTTLAYGLKEPNTFEDVLVSLGAVFPE